MSEVISKEMEQIRAMIIDTVAKRNQLKQEMQEWYESNPTSRFERGNELITVDASLSSLDSHYKRLWDYYNTDVKAC